MSIPFQGRELAIYEEVPAIFIKDDILGLSIILNGYRGYGKDERYILDIYPRRFTRTFGKVESKEFDMSEYMERLLEVTFKDDKTLELLKYS